MSWEFYHVRADSKKIVSGGWAQNEESARLQKPKDNQAVYVLPGGLIEDPMGAEPDFSKLKAYLCDKVDEACANRVSKFAGYHAAKLAEAEDWSPEEDFEDPERFPFLIAETKARRAQGELVDLQTVRNQVVEKAKQAKLEAVQLEAMRVAVRAAIQRAENLPDIVTASLPPPQ